MQHVSLHSADMSKPFVLHVQKLKLYRRAVMRQTGGCISRCRLLRASSGCRAHGSLTMMSSASLWACATRGAVLLVLLLMGTAAAMQNFHLIVACSV